MENIDKNNLKNHIVICNWTSKADTIIKELHAPVIKDKKTIVVVTPNITAIPTHNDIDEYNEVLFLPGDPSDDKVLLHAGIKNAETAIVLADEKLDEYADTKSILIALAVEALQPRVHTVVEILHKKNIIYFKHTLVDEVVCVDELSEKLLAQSSLTHGLSDVYMHLLTATRDTNEVYIIKVPPAFIGKSYKDLNITLIKSNQDVILIGLVTQEVREKHGKKILNHSGSEILGGYLTINPPPTVHLPPNSKKKNMDYILKQEDKIVVIAYEYPDLETLK